MPSEPRPDGWEPVFRKDHDVMTTASKYLLRFLCASGLIIVMASHDLGQVRRLAGDVIFLVRGRLCERKLVVDFLDSPSTPEAARFLRGDLVI